MEQNKEIPLKEFMIQKFKGDPSGMGYFKVNIIKAYSKWATKHAGEQMSYLVLRDMNVLDLAKVMIVANYWVIKIDLTAMVRIQIMYSYTVHPVEVTVSLAKPNGLSNMITVLSSETPPECATHPFVSGMHNLYSQVQVVLGFSHPAIHLRQRERHPETIAREDIQTYVEEPTEDPPLFALAMASAVKDIVQFTGMYLTVLDKLNDPHKLAKMSLTEYREIFKEMETLHDNISLNTIHNAFHGD